MYTLWTRHPQGPPCRHCPQAVSRSHRSRLRRDRKRLRSRPSGRHPIREHSPAHSRPQQAPLVAVIPLGFHPKSSPRDHPLRHPRRRHRRHPLRRHRSSPTLIPFGSPTHSPKGVVQPQPLGSGFAPSFVCICWHSCRQPCLQDTGRETRRWCEERRRIPLTACSLSRHERILTNKHK